MQRPVLLVCLELTFNPACALKHVPELKAYYDRKREEGKSHAVAISHVMRRQLRRLVAVLYDRKAFINLTQEELPQPSN